MENMTKYAFALRTAQAALLSAILAACGGGGSPGTASPPAQTPIPPTSTATLSLLAGSPTESGYIDGAGAAARFDTPMGTAVDAAGNLYVAERFDCVIRKITPSGTVSTFAGSPQRCSTIDGPVASAGFTMPVALAAASNGSLYVTDWMAIRRIDAGGTVTTVATVPAGVGDARSAGLFIPGGIAVDTAGNLVVTNGVGTRKISPSGATTIIEGVDVVNDVFGTNPLAPRGVVVDAAGVVYVGALDGGVKRIDATTATTVLAPDNNRVQALALDPQGNLYVASSDSYVVRRRASSGAVTTLAGTPDSNTFQPGPLPGSLPGAPAGLAVDGKGSLYATSGKAVVKITLP